MTVTDQTKPRPIYRRLERLFERIVAVILFCILVIMAGIVFGFSGAKGYDSAVMLALSGVVTVLTLVAAVLMIVLGVVGRDGPEEETATHE